MTTLIPPKKVVMLLVDALREDLVEMTETNKNYLDHDNSVYKGRKLQLFNQLIKEEPEKTIL
jgi:hypothetical protein